MKVAGFTIIRNAVKYDYPIIESITSLLPICDVFIIAVGNSDDGTLSALFNKTWIKRRNRIWHHRCRIFI